MHFMEPDSCHIHTPPRVPVLSQIKSEFLTVSLWYAA